MINLQTAIDTCFGSVSNPHGTQYAHLNKVLLIPPGEYHIHVPLEVKYLHGGVILGSGRFVTKIIQDTPGQPVFRTNGCGYSRWESMLLQTNGDAPVFDLDWDGSSGGPALQSNSFRDMFFYGGSYGINIGASGFMGSENLFENCFWLMNTKAGLLCSNFNAVQQTVIGGNFQTCGRAIWTGAGSVPVIHGVGFQQSAIADIVTGSNPANSMSVKGCRTESRNFIMNEAGHCIDIAACNQASSEAGTFLQQRGGVAKISACNTTQGQVEAWYWATMKVEQAVFGREDFLKTYQLWTGPGRDATIELDSVWAGNTLHRRKRIISEDDGVTTKTFDYLLRESQ